MQKANGKFIVRIETCVDCGDEFIQKNLSRKLSQECVFPKDAQLAGKNADAKEIHMPAGFQHWEDIQQLKAIVIAYMAADNERKVSNNGIF